jgi:hypothetical protein
LCRLVQVGAPHLHHAFPGNTFFKNQ